MPVLVATRPMQAVEACPCWETEEIPISQGPEGQQVREQIEFETGRRRACYRGRAKPRPLDCHDSIMRSGKQQSRLRCPLPHLSA